MKKILFFLLLCTCGYGAMAQLPINVGVHGGISSNRIKIKDIPNTLGTRAHSGYMAGVFARLNLGKNLHRARPQLFSQRKRVGS